MVVGSMNERMNEWVNKWINGWGMDEWIDR